jgi:hypothetical protein
MSAEKNIGTKKSCTKNCLLYPDTEDDGAFHDMNYEC